MINPVLFLIILVILAIFQVSLVPIPLGLGALIFWFVRAGEKYLALHITVFSVCLAAIANIPVWLVLAATGISFYVFVGAKYFLPERLTTQIGLAIVSLIIWEITMIGLGKLANL